MGRLTAGAIAVAVTGAVSASTTSMFEATPAAKTTPSTLELQGSVDGLFPGAALELPVRIENPYSFAIDVRTVVVTATSVSGCDAGNIEVPSYAGQLRIPPRGEAVLPMVASMRIDAADGCQGVTLPLAYDATAERSRK